MSIRDNLKMLRAREGLSQAALAKKARVSQQLISQLEREENVTTKKLPDIARALNAEIAEIDRNYASEAISSGVRRVRVKGHVQAGEWSETWELPEDEQYDVPVEDEPAFRRFVLHGAETRGPSMNRRYPEGTVLVFTDIIEVGQSLEIGKRYIIERERADGMREATVKTLWRDEADKFWLLPESDDPRFQSPIPLESDEGDTIRIVGRVRYAVSRE